VNARTPQTPPVWRQSDGKAVSCLEKIKVLNQNIQEIETLCTDALEDGVLMGCDVDQIKQALHGLIDSLAEPSTKKG
jgi:phosphoribosylformimino-5-aminoimidazole carboxamide ribonucleotide (ProFAR) isomerase